VAVDQSNTVGVDIGGTFIKGVRWSDRVEAERQVTRPENLTAWVQATSDLVAELATSTTVGVGVGVAGLVRWPSGELLWAPHLTGTNVALRELIAGSTDLPLLVDNDANCAALAEARIGAARGARHAIVLTFGTGIGAGLLQDGKVYRGVSYAGEAGHMTMVPFGDHCACGRRGCWETMVSGRRLDQEAARLARDPASTVARWAGSGMADGTHLVEAAEAGDIAARSALAEAGGWLGRGIANLVALLDPELVVVGGAAAGAGEWLLSPARRELAASLEGGPYRLPPPIVVAAAGPLAGAIGAALLSSDANQ
jgi:glucokinase